MLKYILLSTAILAAPVGAQSLDQPSAIEAATEPLRDDEVVVTGVRAELVGKPSRHAVDTVARRLGVPAHELVIVGDDPDLEIAMARRAGALGVLVRNDGSADADLRLDGVDVPVVPLVVNVFATPLPTIDRCMQVGANVAAAIEGLPGDQRVAVIASGGLSHQLPWPSRWQDPQNDDEEFLVEAWLNGRGDWERYDQHRREIITAATRSFIVSLTGAGSVGIGAAGTTLSGPRAIPPKYFSTSGRAVATSMSPASTSTALLGP